MVESWSASMRVETLALHIGTLTPVLQRFWGPLSTPEWPKEFHHCKTWAGLHPWTLTLNWESPGQSVARPPSTAWESPFPKHLPCLATHLQHNIQLFLYPVTWLHQEFLSSTVARDWLCPVLIPAWENPLHISSRVGMWSGWSALLATELLGHRIIKPWNHWAIELLAHKLLGPRIISQEILGPQSYYYLYTYLIELLSIDLLGHLIITCRIIGPQKY